MRVCIRSYVQFIAIMHELNLLTTLILEFIIWNFCFKTRNWFCFQLTFKVMNICDVLSDGTGSHTATAVRCFVELMV